MGITYYSPHLTLPYVTSPYLTLPHLTLSYLTLLTSPYSPHLTHLTSPHPHLHTLTHTCTHLHTHTYEHRWDYHGYMILNGAETLTAFKSPFHGGKYFALRHSDNFVSFLLQQRPPRHNTTQHNYYQNEMHFDF